MSSHKRIVVVGSINLDLVARAPHIPVAGQTVIGVDFKTFFGGKGANQAVAAARLGATVSLIGQLGDDAFASQLKGGLESAGVDTSAVGIVSGPSGVALISTDEEGENSIIVVPGANGHVTPDLLDRHEDLVRDAAVVLVQLEIPLETVLHLSELTTRHQVPLILDPAPARALPDSLLRRVDWLTPNETETVALLEKEFAELDEAASALLDRGARNVILKLGSRGCYLATSDGLRRRLPGRTVNAVDTTGAGDAFNAAFAAALSSGQDAVASATWATAVAALSVTKPGAQASMPTQAEVDRFLSLAESLKA
ncbi:MAG TPA: ribokinase [Terriglobales bacterium]|jgi:ribokinase|nr:ribokinase [Terriglobales bacterium]